MNGNLMWCAITASLMALGQAHASTFADAVDLTALAEEADGAYLATVTGLTSVPLDASRVESIVTLHVDHSLFGAAEAGETLTVVHAGGTAGARVDLVSGAPRFHTGERVLIFVEARADGRFGVVDDAMGKLEILRDPSSGAELLRADGRLVGASPPSPDGAPPGIPGTLPLSEALRRIPLRPTT